MLKKTTWSSGDLDLETTIDILMSCLCTTVICSRDMDSESNGLSETTN